MKKNSYVLQICSGAFSVFGTLMFVISLFLAWAKVRGEGEALLNMAMSEYLFGLLIIMVVALIALIFSMVFLFSEDRKKLGIGVALLVVAFVSILSLIVYIENEIQSFSELYDYHMSIGEGWVLGLISLICIGISLVLVAIFGLIEVISGGAIRNLRSKDLIQRMNYIENIYENKKLFDSGIIDALIFQKIKKEQISNMLQELTLEEIDYKQRTQILIDWKKLLDEKLIDENEFETIKKNLLR